jgi:hypothetical protein
MVKARVAGLAALCLLATGCGEREPKATPGLPMNELMGHVLDPAADVIWASAGAEITAEGERDLSPIDAEGWLAVENAAATVAETGNLLLLPGRRVDDPVWIENARKLTELGLKTMEAAETKNQQAVFDRGGELYVACSNCHEKFWNE